MISTSMADAFRGACGDGVEARVLLQPLGVPGMDRRLGGRSEALRALHRVPVLADHVLRRRLSKGAELFVPLSEVRYISKI